jgi:hypothetical protein
MLQTFENGETSATGRMSRHFNFFAMCVMIMLTKDAETKTVLGWLDC